MTYIEGFIVPVPEANKAAFTSHANSLSAELGKCGVTRQVEAWGEDLPEGKATDFRKSVDAKPDESVVFAWFEYPSREARDTANQRMMSNSQMMEASGEAPFDAKRMVLGGFRTIVEEGSGEGRFIDGIVVPVPLERQEDYARLARQNAKVFLQNGALRVVETLGDDVPHGNQTDFYRAVKAEPGETVAFSFIEWPDKAARDQGWQKIMQDQSMQHGGGLFDGKRMFWGGFETVIDASRHEQVQASTTPVNA